MTRHLLFAAAVVLCLLCALVCKSYRGTALDTGTYDLHLSTDGRILAVSMLREMTLCDLESGDETGPFPCRFLQFSPDGTLVAARHSDGSVRVWNRLTGQSLCDLPGPVHSLAFSPDGQRFVTSEDDRATRDANDGTLTIRDAGSGGALRTIHLEWRSERPALFSPDGTLLVATGYGSPVFVNRVSDGELLDTLDENWVDQIQFEPGDPEALLVSTQGQTSRYAFDDEGKLELAGQQPAWALEDPLISPDGTHVVGVAGATIQVIDVKSGSAVVTQPAPPYINHHGSHWAAAFSPDGRTLRVATIFGTVTTWDLQTGRQVERITGLGPQRWPLAWTMLVIGAGLWFAAWWMLARPRLTPAEIAVWPREWCDWVLVGANVLIVVGLMVAIKMTGSEAGFLRGAQTLAGRLWLPVCAAAAAAPLLMLLGAITSRARAAAVFALVGGIPLAIGALWLSGGFLLMYMMPAIE